MCVSCAEDVASKRETIFAQLNANGEKPRLVTGLNLISRKENKTVDYLVMIGALVMVAFYALLIHWLLPKT
jgi:hypothetical protein